MKKSIKILSTYDKNYESEANLFLHSVEPYCLKHNYSYRIKKYVDFDRHPSWQKIDLIREELKTSDSDYLLCIDADSIIVDIDADIADETINIDPDKDLWIANQLCTRKSLHRSNLPNGIFRFGTFGRLIGSMLTINQPGIYLQIERPNAGVLLIRNSDWSREFFDKVWSNVKFLENRFYEQAAIQDLMGYHFEPSSGKMRNKLNTEVLNKIGWLPDRWNSVPTLMAISRGTKPLTQQPVNPALLHFAGMEKNTRLEQMKLLIGKINTPMIGLK